jgi:hypothetical protein
MYSCTSGSARIVTTVAVATVVSFALSRSAKSNVIGTKSVASSAVRWILPDRAEKTRWAAAGSAQKLNSCPWSVPSPAPQHRFPCVVLPPMM